MRISLSELPPAFIRRCVTYRIPVPTEAKLRRIAAAHLAPDGGELAPEDETLVERLAAKVAASHKERPENPAAPSIAEFLDALRACKALDATRLDDRTWEWIERVALHKGRSGA